MNCALVTEIVTVLYGRLWHQDGACAFVEIELFVARLCVPEGAWNSPFLDRFAFRLRDLSLNGDRINLNCCVVLSRVVVMRLWYEGRRYVLGRFYVGLWKPV